MLGGVIDGYYYVLWGSMFIFGSIHNKEWIHPYQDGTNNSTSCNHKSFNQVTIKQASSKMWFVILLLGLPLVGSNLRDEVHALLQGPGGYILNAMRLEEFLFFFTLMIFVKPLLEYRVGEAHGGLGIRSRGSDLLKSLLEVIYQQRRDWMRYFRNDEYLLLIGNRSFVA